MVRDAEAPPPDIDQARARRWLALIVVLGLLLRLAAALLFDPDQSPITFEYGTISRSLVDTGVYGFDLYGYEELHESSFMPPIYPLVLAITMALAGSRFFMVLRLIQVFVSTLGMIFGYGIARQALGRRDVALIAALGMAVYPPFIGHVTQVDTATFDVVLLQGFVLFSLWGVRRSRAREFLVAGAWLGLAGLTRAPALIAIAAVPVGLAAARRPFRDVLRLTGIAGLGMLALVAPWSIRNTVVQGAPVLVSTNGGMNFWIGNHTGATGEFVWTEVSPMLQRTRGMNETERDAFFYQQSYDFIRNHPDQFLGLLGRKLFYFLWFRPGLGESYEGLGDLVGAARSAYTLSYAALLPLALIGIVVTLIRWRDLALVYCVMLGYLLVSILFFVATRFRAPIEAYLILFAARSLMWTNRVARRRFVRSRS